MLKVRNPTDFWAGMLFVVVGGTAAWMASGYRMGTAQAMGPGYLPTILAWGVIVCGVVVATRSVAVDGPKVSAIGWRPAVLVFGAVAAFGLLIDRFGLVAAILAAVFIGAAAYRGTRILEVALLALGLTVFSVVLFVLLLGQAIPIWPRW
jgi:hypothetical protein